MEFRRYRQLSALFALYFFFSSTVVLLLFVVGNYQSFLESTSFLLLQLLEWIFSIMIISLIYYFVFSFLERGVERRKGQHLVWSFVGLLYAGAFLFLINTIFAWL
ncbi:MAG TPA: hypothetical protein ENN41_03705 [Sediminispirochaeta sp.]|nr:hypothetical protein [Sediminispirochaeta sp.]